MLDRRSFFGAVAAALVAGPTALYGLVRQKPVKHKAPIHLINLRVVDQHGWTGYGHGTGCPVTWFTKAPSITGRVEEERFVGSWWTAQAMDRLPPSSC